MLNQYVGNCIDGDVLSALSEIGMTDNDFNGSNGDEYLWDETIEKGFTSNLEYALDYVKNLPPYDCVENFMDMWLCNDSYYTDYAYTLLVDDNNVPQYVVLSVIVD